MTAAAPWPHPAVWAAARFPPAAALFARPQTLKALTPAAAPWPHPAAAGAVRAAVGSAPAAAGFPAALPADRIRPAPPTELLSSKRSLLSVSSVIPPLSVCKPFFTNSIARRVKKVELVLTHSSTVFLFYGFTTFCGLPCWKARMLSSTICMQRRRACSGAQAMCGVTIQCGCSISGEPCTGGSSASTSMAA